MRHNGGGRVKEMSAALDPLLGEGTIMTLRMKNGSETVYTSDADRIDLPIAVLIDDQSISAAEFFAAALQEYDRATLVGTHTTGKGRAERRLGGQSVCRGILYAQGQKPCGCRHCAGH